MSNEDNGNIFASTSVLKPTSSSNEDLSEYTDADESISAPTEFLAEFLSAVMLKDYETALKYCKLILQYEPNNVTAKEFYPLILEKIQNNLNKLDTNLLSDNSSQSSSDSEEGEACTDEDSNDPESNTGSSSDSFVEEDDGSNESKQGSLDGDATTASYSSLEDDEAEPDQLTNLIAKFTLDNVNLGNGNKIFSCASTAKWDMKSLSTDSTTLPFGISTDSESPTEPVSQKTIDLLRSTVVPPNH